MAVRFRSHSLDNKELQALYGEGREHYFSRDEDGTSEEFDLDSECSEDGKGGGGVRSSLSLEIYGLQREQRVHFSNREYYRKLEELKRAHLRNMAELERMYISQGSERHAEEDDGCLGGGSHREARQPISSSTERLKKINSQEELDFHELSSGSDQSELFGDDNFRERLLDNARQSTPGLRRTFGRDSLLSPEDTMNDKKFRFQKASCPKPQGRRHTGIRARSNSNVTIPKPFQMMLREEERKRHKVRTRSEIDLENTLLRHELEELRECQKKFRASPAPVHTHLPLYDVISRRRSTQQQNQSNITNRNTKCYEASVVATPLPFHFLDRERRKREVKIVAELAKLGVKEEQQVFKARPMPSLMYGGKHRADTDTTSHQPVTICTLEREVKEGQRAPSPDLEPHTRHKSEASSPQRCPSVKGAKKQIELSIEMVKGREWSYMDTLKATACNICSPLQPGGQEPPLTNKTPSACDTVFRQ